MCHDILDFLQASLQNKTKTKQNITMKKKRKKKEKTEKKKKILLKFPLKDEVHMDDLKQDIFGWSCSI